MIQEIYFENNSIPWGIAINVPAEKLYWASTAKIQRSNLDGTGIETFALGSNNREIELDPLGGKMYWTDQGSGFIRRANLDGTAVENLQHTGAPTGLAIDTQHDRMFWIDPGGPTRIYRSQLDGSDAHCLIGAHIDCVNQALLPGAVSLELNGAGDTLYWTDQVSKEIRRANIDGTGFQTVLSGLGFPLGLDIVGDSLHWTDSVGINSYVIKRANLDGNGTTVLVTGLEASFGVAVVPEPSALTTFLLGALFLRRRRRRLRPSCSRVERVLLAFHG